MRIVLAETASPVLGQQFEVLVDWVPPILLGMVVGTVILFTLLVLFAGIYFVVSRMVLLLLPTVALLASVFVRAPVRVRSYEVVYVPIFAKISFIIVYVRLPS